MKKFLITLFTVALMMTSLPNSAIEVLAEETQTMEYTIYPTPQRVVYGDTVFLLKILISLQVNRLMKEQSTD